MKKEIYDKVKAAISRELPRDERTVVLKTILEADLKRKEIVNLNFTVNYLLMFIEELNKTKQEREKFELVKDTILSNKELKEEEEEIKILERGLH